MTNITLSIDDKVYKKMRRYSEIKWSEFVRKMIHHRITELEGLEKNDKSGSIFAMIASQEALKKHWDNKEDEIWDNLQ
ncbi:hypothetical protein J4447_04835 [Candidatus Pacearchaeota archaeon]|nr:hypothetical protein [Candidatus Pacearchaeota archaeon]